MYKDSSLAEAYSYDGQGNRTSEANMLRGVSRTYTHDDEDKIVYAGADIYTYDVDGFLTSRAISSGAYSGAATFDYSSRGELLSATLPDANVISYDHDPMGRRIAKRVNGTITEKYLWQDATTLLAVYDGSDNLIQRFEYADGRMPVAMTYQGAVYYFGYDQVGSLRAVFDSTGTLVKQVDYDSFGNVLSDSDPAFSVPFGFAGGLHDRDTGLVRFGARDYDPATGKWTAKDPIDFGGGDLNLLGYCDIVGKPSIQTNLYLYTGADPINRIDPLGLWSVKDLNPRARAILSLGASKLAEYAANNLEPGKARGAVFLVGAGLASYATVEATIVAAGSWVVMTGGIATGNVPAAIGGGLLFFASSGVAAYDLRLSAQLYYYAVGDFLGEDRAGLNQQNPCQ